MTLGSSYLTTGRDLLLSLHISGQDSISCRLLNWGPQFLVSGYLKAVLSSLTCDSFYMAACFIKVNKGESLLVRWKLESFCNLIMEVASSLLEVSYWLGSNYSREEDNTRVWISRSRIIGVCLTWGNDTYFTRLLWILKEVTYI